MIRAINKIPVMPSSAGHTNSTGGGGGSAGVPVVAQRAAFYMNRTVKTELQIQQRMDSRAFLTMENIAGRPVHSFLGVPVRTTDALLNAEARVI